MSGLFLVESRTSVTMWCTSLGISGHLGGDSPVLLGYRWQLLLLLRSEALVKPLPWGPSLRGRAMVGLARVVRVQPGAEVCVELRQALIVLCKAAQIQGLVSGNAVDFVVGEPGRAEGDEGVCQHCWEAEEARGFREATPAVVLNGAQAGHAQPAGSSS